MGADEQMCAQVVAADISDQKTAIKHQTNKN